MPDRLPGPHQPITLGVVACAAKGCNSRSLASPALDDRGQPRLAPPPHWGEITAVLDNGDQFQMFVCSPSCERRLAMNLAQPSHGSLN